MYLSIQLSILYRNHPIQVKTAEGGPESSCINESISFQGPMYLCWTVSWQWQKKISLMDIGQSVQISAGSWIVHMARPESQVERPKKNYRSRAFSNLGRLMQDPVIMRDRLVLTLSFFPTGGALPTTLVSVTSFLELDLAEAVDFFLENHVVPLFSWYRFGLSWFWCLK